MVMSSTARNCKSYWKEAALLLVPSEDQTLCSGLGAPSLASQESPPLRRRPHHQPRASLQTLEEKEKMSKRDQEELGRKLFTISFFFQKLLETFTSPFKNFQNQKNPPQHALGTGQVGGFMYPLLHQQERPLSEATEHPNILPSHLHCLTTHIVELTLNGINFSF